MQTAREAIESGRYRTIAEVSYAAGFDTPAYFGKLFKEHYGRDVNVALNLTVDYLLIVFLVLGVFYLQGMTFAPNGGFIKLNGSFIISLLGSFVTYNRPLI